MHITYIDIVGVECLRCYYHLTDTIINFVLCLGKNVLQNVAASCIIKMKKGRQFFETVLTIETIRRDVSLEGSAYAGRAKSMHELNQIVEKSARKAHLKNNTPNIRLTVSELSAKSFGYMVYFFEKACAVSCYLTGVNPFDQPGVEDYKRNMFALLGKPGYESQKEELEKKMKL